MSKVLVDTNIFVYGIDEDSAFFKRARKILEQEKYQLVTTSKNLIVQRTPKENSLPLQPNL